ncbi:hypothetical protein BHE89_05155 [Shigella sp. FC1967]|nr:hypothetical protein BHE89_05155 [Shigella sp. FC1967]
MAWNQPGNNGQDRDPWGNRNSGNNNGDGNGNSNGNQGGRNRGASDLDDMFRKLSEKTWWFRRQKKVETPLLAKMAVPVAMLEIF